MTERVDFYVLKSTAARQRWLVACRLAEKAYLKNLKTVIVNESLADAQALDELLWTFNDRAFLPHEVCEAHAELDAPIRLTLSDDAPQADLLVNMTQRLPAHADRYARIIEIIDGDEERKRLGRERFKAYRDLKLVLETHQLNESAEV